MSQGFDDKHRGSVFNRLGKRRSTIPSTHDDSFSHRTPYPNNNEQHYTRSFHSEPYTDETSGHYHHSSRNDNFGDQDSSSYHPGNLIITAPARGGDRFVFNGSSSEQQLLTAPYYAAEEQQPVVWTESQYPSQSITPIQLNPSYTSEVPLPTSTRFFNNAPGSPASSTTANGRRDTYIPDYARLHQSKKPRKNELPPEPKKRRTVTPTPSTPPPSLSPKVGVTKPVTQEERCSSGESVISMDLDSDNLMLPDWGEDNDNEAKLQAIARENRRQHEIEQEQSRLRREEEEERRLAEKERLLEEEKTRKLSQSEEKLKEEELRQARWERFCREEEERDALKRREEEEHRRQEEEKEKERKKQEERKQRVAEERRRKQQEAFERVKKEQAERARLEEQKRQAEEAARLKCQAEEAARLKQQAEETARLKRQAEEALRLKREQEAAERNRRELERQERKRREKEQQEEDQRRQETVRRQREREERHRMEKEQREQEEFERRQREDEERRKQLEDERLRQEEQVRQLLLQQQQQEEEERQKKLEEERMQQEQQQAQQEAAAAEMPVKQELMADAPQEYDDNGPLPTGWQVHYSRSTDQSYFYNVTTGESTWERPRMESTQDTQLLQLGEVAPETTPDPTIAQQESTSAVQLEAKPLTHDAIAEIPPQLENVDTAAAAAFVPETNAVLSPTLEEEFADMIPQAVYSMPPSNESRDPRIQAMKRIEQDKQEMDAQPVKPASHYFVQHRFGPRAPRPSEPNKAANNYRFPPLEYRPKMGPPFRVGRKDSYVPNYRPSTSAVSRRRDQ